MILIFAGSNGFLDKIEVERLSEFESGLFDFLDASHSNILDNIKNSGAISDEDSKVLKNTLNDFVKGF